MTKIIIKILLIFILLSTTFISVSNAYENEIFSFDLPDGYGAMEYKEGNQGMYVFAQAESKRGLIVYVKDDKALKKSVWNIEESDLNRIKSLFSINGSNIQTDKKAKLGKEKAIKFTLNNNGEYMELYILASNNHIYMVVFTGKSNAELNNDEYKMIKDSFKLKDRTTNPTVIYILVIGIIVAIVFFTKYRKQQKGFTTMTQSNDIDYKNMTEDDFNNIK